MKHSRFAVAMFATLAVLLLMGTGETLAQKKKTPAKPTEQTAAPAAQPAPSPSAVRLGGTIKDLLVKYKGELTSLGVLTQVESDYFIAEEDGKPVVHPISTIRWIKILKVEEDADEEDSPKLDIRLQ